MESLSDIIKSYKHDPASVYNTWFIGNEEIESVRAIKRGVIQVIEDIKTKNLEMILRVIA